MAKLSKEYRLKRIEEQIKKKKQLMKEIQQSIQISIGKTVMEEWEIEDDEIANEIIRKLKDQAKELIRQSQSNEGWSLMNKKRELDRVTQEYETLLRRKKHLKSQMEIKIKNEERKKRANRLIQTGALAEKYFDIHSLSISEREELFKIFSPFIKANKPKRFQNKKTPEQE